MLSIGVINRVEQIEVTHGKKKKQPTTVIWDE